MTRPFRNSLLTLLFAFPLPRGVNSQVPKSAVNAIVEEFTRHRVVAIAEAHGLRNAGEFYVSLVRDSAFERLAPDIVIEFASRQSQELLDAYVVRGDSIPADTLRTIWRNTTKVASWESPIYARWLAAIRDVNRSLAPSRRLRVIAGDTRVDWLRMHTPADWAKLGDNDVSFADIIANDILARGHRALVVLGSNHLMRTGTRTDEPNTTTRVESKFPGSMYVAWLYNGRPGGGEADVRMTTERWSAPLLVDLGNSWLGGIPAGRHRFSEVADAVLFLGTSTQLQVEEPTSDYFDIAYRRELDRRSLIEWGDSSRARTFLKLAPPPPSGSVVERMVRSAKYGRERRVWVYTPTGYPDACGTGCPLVVAFDGGVYLDAIPLPAILDSMIASKALQPTIALLIDNASGAERLADLANQPRFAEFMSDELMPWLRSNWKVTANPSRTIITGSSAGGLASAYLAFLHPELFGNVLSQSGALWRGSAGSNNAPFEWLTTEYAATGKRPVRFFVDVGSAESGGAMNGTAPSILDANRRFRDVLTSKGYSVQYFEVPLGQHSPESWRLRLPIGLATLAR
jgi:enterochelin esterase-like enzyme